jgi:hypothetical protein
MSDENNTPDTANTPDLNSYDSSIPTPDTGGEQEPNEAPFSLDENSELFEGGNPVIGLATGSVDRGSVSGEHLASLEGYTNRFTDMEQAFSDAAINQGVWGALGNGLQRAGTEIVGGAIEGIGAIGAIFDEERWTHENFLEELGRNIRQSTDDAEIWERNRGESWQFGDAAWWAKNLPSIASSISMMVPALAVGRGVSLLGKAARLSRLGKTAKAAGAITKIETVTGNVLGGATMRHAENMREAHGVYEEAKSEVLQSRVPLEGFKGTDAWQSFVADNNRRPVTVNELADYVGGAAAKRSYSVNAINVVSDIAQFSMWGKAFRATRGAASASTRAAAQAATAGGEVAKRGLLSRVGAPVLGFAVRDMGSEGIEELVNHIGNKEGMYHAMRMTELGEESTLDERLKMYLSDDHAWEAAFFGAIGGGVFSGARHAVDKIQGKGTAQQERILELSRHSLARMNDAASIAGKVEKGELTPEQGRAQVAGMVFEDAFAHSEAGTADVFEQQIADALAQMEKDGVSQERRNEFQEEAMSAMQVAEQSVQEAHLALNSIEGLSDGARTLIKQQFASISHQQHMNKRHAESLGKRLEGVDNVEEQRAAILRTALAEVQETLKNLPADHKDRAAIESEAKILDKLVSSLPAGTESAEDAVAKVEEQIATEKEKESKRESLETQADEQIAKEQHTTRMADLEADLEAAKAAAPAALEINPLVEELVGTEVGDVMLASAKEDLLSKEGIDTMEKLAEAVKEAQKKKEESRTSGVSDMTEEQIQSELKRLDPKKEAERVAQLEEELKQRKIKRENDNQTTLEQRSRDIEVPEAAQAAIDKLVEDTENLEGVNEDGTVATDGNFKYYRDKRTGKLYMRTTTFIHNGKGKDIAPMWGIPSSNIGNSVDLFVRDYFDGNIGANEYPHLPENLQAKLREELMALEEKFIANGEKVVPHDVTLMADHFAATEMDGNVAGVAGTVDLLTVDKDGNIRIYDMKTVRDAAMVKDIWEDGQKTGRVGTRVGIDQNLTTGERTGKWGERQDKEQTAGYERQVSTYAIMAELSTGLPVVEGGIIPLDVAYTPTKKMTVEELQAIEAGDATLMPTIPVELQPEVNGLKVPETPQEPDPDPDPDPNDTPFEDNTEAIEALAERIAKQEARVRKHVEAGNTGLAKAENKILNKLLAQMAELGASYVPVVDQTPEETVPTDEEPINTEIETGTMSLPLGNLLTYFAGRLQVVKDWNRDNLLVHGHEGILQIGDAESAARYALVRDVIQGTSQNKVTFRVEGTQAVQSSQFKSFLKKGPIEEVQQMEGVIAVEGKKGQYVYRSNAGDSLTISLYIGDTKIGELPTTGELLEASSDRFDAVSGYGIASKRFGTDSRLGNVKTRENQMMSEATQDAHLENAITVHALRQAILLGAPSTKGQGVVVEVSTEGGKTTLGETAVGSLILDTSFEVTARSAGESAENTVLTQGIALALPGTGEGQVVQVYGSEKNMVTPYGQNEQEGSTTTNMGWYSSGALFMPVQHGNQTLWVKAPGQTISQLARGTEIADALVELLAPATLTEVNFGRAQNILGSNALQQTKDGGWAIFPTNQNGGIIAGALPLSELLPDSGVWTNDPATIIPNMPLDIAVEVMGEESAYRSGGELDLGREGEEGIFWPNLAAFAAENIRLGYAPVTDASGEVQGWTHPLAPAYARNDSNPGQSAEYHGKVLFNENANATQARLVANDFAMAGVSGKALVEKLTNETKEELVSGIASIRGIKVQPKEETSEVWDGPSEESLAARKRKEEGEMKRRRKRWMTVEEAEAANNAETNTEIDMEIADEWWSENMPNVPFKRVKGIIKRDGIEGYGLFEQGAVLVSNLGVRGTEYHEAFHAVTWLYLDPVRRAKVLEDAKRLYGENLTEEQLEEKLAEDFREYMLTSGLSMKEKSTVRRFFSELLELLTALFKDGFAGYRKMQLQQQINRGKFANRTGKMDNVATRWMKAIPGVTWSTNAVVMEELQGVLKTNLFDAIRNGNVYGYPGMDTFERLASASAEDVRRNLGEETSKWEEATRALLNVAFDGPMAWASADAKAAMKLIDPNMAAIENVESLMGADRAAIIEHFAKDASTQKYVKGLVEGVDTAGTSENEQYDDDRFQKMNPKDSLSATVRDIIQGTPLITRRTADNSPQLKEAIVAAELAMKDAMTAKELGNTKAEEQALEQLNSSLAHISDLVGDTAHASFFGMPRGMNLDLNFPFLSQRLSDASTFEEMVSRLHDMGTVYPEFSLLAGRLVNEGQDVQAQFFAGFRRTSTENVLVSNFKATTSRPHATTLANHNQSGVARALADLDPSKVHERAEKLKTPADGKTIGEVAADLEAFLNDIGFSTLDPAALGVKLVDVAANPQAYKNLLTRVQAVIAAYQSMTAEGLSEEAYEKSARSFRAQVGKLSEPFAAYDRGAVSSTLKDAKGTRVFSKQVPAFIGRWFDSIKRQTGESDAAWGKRLAETVFADPRMAATTYAQKLFKNGNLARFQPEAAAKLEVLRVGGFTKGEGVQYTDMTNAEWILYQWSALRGVDGVGPMWPMTTPSDAGGSYMVPVEVYNPASEAGRTKTMMALRRIIAAEVIELKTRTGRFSNPKVDAYMKQHFAATEATAGKDFWQIGTTAQNNEAVDAAAEILYKELMAEAEVMREHRDFTDAVELLPTWMADTNLNEVPATMAVTGFIANWTHAVALAGTHNEFKQNADSNTVDMQKRHKHVLSPSVANAGVSSKTEFVSVTMTDKKFDLSEDVPALKRWKQYGGVEIADAQSYVTLDMYRYILLEHGDMRPEMEEVFEALDNGQPLSKDMKNKLLRPYKPFYYTRIMGADGLLHSVQIKNSIIPLVPGLSDGHDAMAKWMADKGIDQVQMGTAQKVGTPLKADGSKNTADLVNDSGEFEVVNFDDSMLQTLPMEGYGKQVQVTDHLHSDSTNKVLSQMERISIAYAVRNLGAKGQAIRNEFMDALDSVYAEQAREFFDQFNDENGNHSPEAFKSWMTEQAIAADATSAQMELIEQGLFTAPQVTGLVRSRIFSAIDNQAKQVRVLGGTGVQISSQFHRNRANRLKGMRVENGVVKPAEVAISRDFLPKKYRDMSIEELREQAPEVLEMFTARIPSEGMNSGSLIEVVEFLPDGMDGVVVPDEFVTQMGSDFDVDKLFFVWKDHLNPDAPMNKLYDAMTAPYREADMLPHIQAPQGFDTLAGIAVVRGLRTPEEQQHIKDNPYSVMTHLYLTGDNKAGIALKGQAANKNLILLDFIRNEFIFDTDFGLNNKKAGFNWRTISQGTITLHAEAVAAAMDGAKDPVYGKLGINNRNFSIFESLLLLSDGMDSIESYVHPDTKEHMPIPGNLSFATAVMQSEPMKLLSAGDIRIKGRGKKTEVIGDTAKGMQFVQRIAKAGNLKAENGAVTLPGNRNIKVSINMSDNQLMLLTSGIGQFQKHISNKIKQQGEAMRVDRHRTSDYIETVASQDILEFSQHNSVEGGPVLDMSYRAADGSRTSQPFDVQTKGTVRGMYEGAIKVLTDVGDGYLALRGEMGASLMASTLSFGAYDSYIAAKAADQSGALHTTYAAMGERDSRAVESLPENREEYSFEQWHRHFSRNKQLLLTNNDLSLVLGKVLLQPTPYKFPTGKYADNFTLIGINDDIEKAEVQKAVDRLWLSGDTDIRMFLEQMVTYEAQRSRFNMSQSRLTAILPSELQASIAKAGGEGASQTSDGAGQLDGMSLVAAIHKNQAFNSRAPFLGEFKSVGEAIAAAESASFHTTRRAVVKGEAVVVIPISENEEGVDYSMYPSPNNGENFAGKQLAEPLFGSEVIAIELSEDDYTEEESRLEYGPELHATEKIAFLERRFRNVGVPVTVVMDATLPSNGKVKIDKETATVYLHPDMLQGDTIAHEFGHILIEGLGENHPLVVQGILQLKGTELWAEVEAAYPDLDAKRLAKEVLVTALGREASDLFTERKEQTRFQTWMNRIMRAIGKLFGIQPKATRELADMLMGEGSMPTLNLSNVETVEEQRAGKRRSGTDVSKDFAKKWAELFKQLNTRKYTNTQFEIAASQLRNELKAGTQGTIGKKLEAINGVAQATILNATSTTSKLEAITTSGFNTPAMNTREAAILADAHTALQRLETMRQVLEGMDPEGGGNAAITEAYAQLQDQYDIITRAEYALKEVLASTISKQLMTNSKNPKIQEWVRENQSTIFELVNDKEMREMMTDVTSITKGSLGVKEFKNPVMQLIAKQLQQTVETARLDGRQAEMKIADILKEAAAKGVQLEDIVDTSTGKFVTEVSSAYTAGARKARIALQSGKELEWLKFHLDNSSMQYAREFYQQFQSPTVAMRKLADEVNELNNAINKLGLTSLKGSLAIAEQKLHAIVEQQAGLITKFHNVTVKDGFEAARNEAGQKGAEALAAFDAKHGVVTISGTATPLSPASRFVELSVKEEYLNKSYTGLTGEPVPMSKHINPAYASLGESARKALAEVRSVMGEAMGANSEFFEEGSIPFYSVVEDKTKVSFLDGLRNRKKAVVDTAKNIKDPNREKMAERVLVDASGNPIYTRDYKVTAASAEQVKAFETLEDLAKHLGEAAKQAHKESAKALIEPFSYLTRDIFNASEIVDGRHVILAGKKGERYREFRKKQVAGTNISVALDQWLEGMLGDNWEDASPYDGAVSAFQQYTSLMGVGINLSAWFNNYAYGNVQRMLETRGEDLFSKENNRRARKLLGANVIGMTGDIVNNKRAGYASDVSALVNLLDIADDQRELPFGKRETFNSKLANSLYVGQTMGEVLMQNQVAFAMMMEVEVFDKDGKPAGNLFDAFMKTFDSEAGVIGMPDVYVMKNGKQEKFTTADLAAFRNKAKSINHYIHGAYNKQDAGTWQRQFWGRALMQFRRWLPMNMKKRFASDQFNESRERNEQGWYRSLMQFMGIVVQNAKDVAGMKAAVEALKEESPHVYRGAMTAAIEIGTGIGMFLLLCAMYAMMDEDDEDNYLTGVVLNRTQRLMQEMNTYTPWGLADTFGQFSENPFASMTRIEGFGGILSQAIEDSARLVFKGEGPETYASGVNKGNWKLGIGLAKATPAVSHFIRLSQMGEMQKQYSVAKEFADWFED